MQGMLVVTFAVLAGFGLTALCGIPFSPLAGSVVPFLALGLGKDHNTNLLCPFAITCNLEYTKAQPQALSKTKIFVLCLVLLMT